MLSSCPPSRAGSDLCHSFLGKIIFTPPSPATAPEDVIPKVEPRLRDSSLRNSLFKMHKSNKIKLKTQAGIKLGLMELTVLEDTRLVLLVCTIFTV